ncbi:MAG: DUF378 domain-containing protein [bacterium]|nr:DUF378 domain-containing protein [bacterium]
MFKFLRFTSFLFVIIGALNWGLVGLFGFDLVAFLFGEMTFLTRLLYGLVGLSGLIAPAVWVIYRNRCYCEDD